MNTYTIADEIGKLTPEQKAKRKAKIKKGGQNFLFGIAFINLLPIRAAFNAIVAMNLNAFASNLKWIYDNRNGKTKEGWAKLAKIWHKVGGLEKALLKAIQLGTKHKPLFLSKKAKLRYEKRKKERGEVSDAIFLGEDGGIGNPAVIAPIVAAAAGIIAAMLPVIMKSLKQGGQPAAAAEVEQQGQDMVDNARENPAQFQAQVAQGADEQIQTDEQGQAVEEYIGELDISALTSSLSSLAEIGIKAAGTAIAKKAAKHPKTKKFLEGANQATEDYATGRYLRKSGYTDAAKQFTSGAGGYLPIILGAGAVGALFLFMKKK
jgi:hypothetical protein